MGKILSERRETVPCAGCKTPMPDTVVAVIENDRVFGQDVAHGTHETVFEPYCEACRRKQRGVLEEKACAGCGYVRRVKMHYARGDVSDPKNRWWRQLCDACEAERAAETHLAGYRRMQNKAKALRDKQVLAKMARAVRRDKNG